MNMRTVNGWLRIAAEMPDETAPVEVQIYDQIGRDWFSGSGIEAAFMRAELDRIPANKEINLHIHSPGGDVFDGLAIYNLLAQRRGKLTVYNDGLCASIASIIALAGKEFVMPETALYMIHDPSGLVIGTSADMRELADLLDKNGDIMANIYASYAGGSTKKWRERMRDTTWYDGKEALRAGIANRTIACEPIKAEFNLQREGRFKMAAALDLSRCTLAGAPGNAQPASIGGKPKNKTMNRDKIIALLKTHGVNPADDATDEMLVAELDKLVTAGKVKADEKTKLTAAAPAPASNLVSREEFEAIQAQLKAANDKRITAELDALIRENENIVREDWLPSVLADESVLEKLKKLPKPQPIAGPIRPGRITVGNTIWDEYKKMRAGAERQAFRLSNFDELSSIKRSFNPRADNTMDAALVTDFLADGLIVVSNNKLAALSGFSRDFGVDPMKPRATVQVRKALTGSTAQTNPTNFETGDGAVDNIPVTVNQISQSFHITNDELNKGFRLQHLAEKNAMVFANAISDVWTALILAATYAAPAPVVIGAATLFDQGTLATIYGAAKNFSARNLILDGAYVGRLIATINPFAFKQANAPDRSYPGFDLIAEQNRWTAATANTVGIICGPDGIAVASGVPLDLPPGEFLADTTIVLEGIGLSVKAYTWFSRAGRVWWSSFDVMFGAAPGDTTQLALLKSA